ncbi:MAG: type 2 isopentenyl-diphosphate Delta-isomerase [Myxococcales bacterium]|nr:type 2 isopentenyl-diphosphate Delta-isomerase [Myxococcales bacterium]
MGEIEQRKVDHLELCATDEVAFREKSTLLECVQLVHNSLPDLSERSLDTSVKLLGKELRAPLIIAAMTGGSEPSAEVNHCLSAVAEARGYGFGLGSQRAMQRAPETAWTYEVRQHAPTTLLLGNVGVVQARDTPTAELVKLVEDIGADALCVHMNPAQELVQPGGDRDFRGGLQTFERLVRELPFPVVAKETGNGIGKGTAAALRQVGVQVCDVSGAGGTSWVGVEALRAEPTARALGELLWDWGVPTAAAVAHAHAAGLEPIATGGIKTGLDVARAIALGARAAGIARPLLQAFKQGGREAVETFLDGVELQLRAVMLLCGARDLEALRRHERVITGELCTWTAQL